MTDRQIPPLEPDLASLLDDERARPAPPPETRSRVRARLGVTLGLGGAATSAALEAGHLAAEGVPVASSVAATGGTALAIKVGVALLVAGTVGGLYAAVRWQPSPRVVFVAAPPPAPTPVLAPAPIVAPPPVAPTPIAPVAAAAPTARAHALVRHAPATDDLAAERRILDAARDALARGDAPAALGLVSRHGRQFPRGQLVEERESLWVRALAAAGQGDAARTRAGEFRRRWPTSIFLPAVDATVRALP